jgi:hypothetical protein
MTTSSCTHPAYGRHSQALVAGASFALLRGRRTDGGVQFVGQALDLRRTDPLEHLQRLRQEISSLGGVVGCDGAAAEVGRACASSRVLAIALASLRNCWYRAARRCHGRCPELVPPKPRAVTG